MAPLGPDWISIDSPPFGVAEDRKLQTWFSGNGLDWFEAGLLPLHAAPAGEGVACGEFPMLVSTGSLVVASTTLAYPCGEGRVERFGSAHVTSDGSTWAPLSFANSIDPADPPTRGTRIAAGVDLEAGTLLVGENNYRATFWFRPTD